METTFKKIQEPYKLDVLTVPMRNGNFYTYIYKKYSIYRSYRTYEEWKLSSLPTISQRLVSSYRTYEEWKPRTAIIFLSPNGRFLPYLWGMETQVTTWRLSGSMRSYRTYEEWKPGIVIGGVLYLFLVLTVPMRNGNWISEIVCCEVYPRFLPYLWGMETILIVFFPILNSLWFLPYLWGMETFHNCILFRDVSVFLPYLWGMETECKNIAQIRVCKFLPYLWGMETIISCKKFIYKLTWFLPYLWGMET